MPSPPEIDAITAELLRAYNVISKARQYVGMIGAPAPISLSAIADYLNHYPSAICREEFDAVIFALDDEFRSHWAEQNSRSN